MKRLVPMRIAVLVVLALVGVGGCHPGPVVRPDASSPEVALPARDDAGAPARGQSTSLAADALHHPVAGPLRVVGYPINLSTGNNDVPDFGGFTTEGERFGVCGSNPAEEFCGWIQADGRPSCFHDASWNGAMARRARADGLAPFQNKGPANVTTGPALTGTWEFSDIVIHVRPSSVIPTSSSPRTVRPVLSIGGSVDGQSPVFPERLVAGEVRPITGGEDVVALLPGVVAHHAVRHELGIEGFVLAAGESAGGHAALWRMADHAFAARVYNDTGFRHHGAKDWARSAQLFEKAARTDPSFRLAAYNLACAWARLGDERANGALVQAIALDPDARRKAAADADFDTVREAPWFRALVP